MFEAPTNEDFRRVAQLISYGVPLDEIHTKLVTNGTLTEEEFFFCFKAAQRMVEKAVVCLHGVPQVLHIKMTTTFFSPDTERCEPCRLAEEEREREQEAKTDAFLARLAARRKAAS